jgi:hypothetical protein
MHRHHHLIKATWLEKKPDGTENAYVPGTDDNVLAGSIICRVKLKDITDKGHACLTSAPPCAAPPR